MKTTSSRPGRPGVVFDHSSASFFSSSRMVARALGSTDSSRQSRSTSPASPNGEATTVSVASAALISGPCWDSWCRARRSRRLSNFIRTVLMRPSSTSAPVADQALYQTVRTSSRGFNSARTRLIRLLLPMPQPASTASVKGVAALESWMSVASWRAAVPAPSRSPSGALTGSSLNSENFMPCLPFGRVNVPSRTRRVSCGGKHEARRVTGP